MEDLSYLFGDEKDKICAFYRGYIIHKVVSIEELIDYYFITYYLRPKITNKASGLGVFTMIVDYTEKENEFLHTILEKERFNLSFKLDALFFLFNKYCKDYLSNNPTFLATIKELIDMRNAFAHRKLSDEKCDIQKREITLIYHTSERKKAKVEELVMNPDKLKEFSDKYLTVINCLIDAGNILIKS